MLLAVNDTSLISLTHNEAVQCLKSSSTQPRRVLHVLQVGQPSSSAAGVNFRPMWTYWLSLPPCVSPTPHRHEPLQCRLQGWGLGRASKHPPPNMLGLSANQYILMHFYRYQEFRTSRCLSVFAEEGLLTISHC